MTTDQAIERLQQIGDRLDAVIKDGAAVLPAPETSEAAIYSAAPFLARSASSELKTAIAVLVRVETLLSFFEQTVLPEVASQAEEMSKKSSRNGKGGKHEH